MNMATNKVPKKLDHLITLAAGLADGCKAQEANVGLKQNTEANLRADLAAAIRGRNDYKNRPRRRHNLDCRRDSRRYQRQSFHRNSQGRVGEFPGQTMVGSVVTRWVSQQLAGDPRP